MNIETIIKTDAKVYMNTFGPRTPIAFAKGEGSTLYDTQGKEYQDFFAGIAVNALGYHHPAMVKALKDQIDTGILHTSNIFYNVPQAQLVELLVKNSPFDRAFITNSGTEAIEGAIKLARKVFYERGEDRTQVISAMGSFHGRTLGAVAATGQPKYQAPYKSLLPTAIVNVAYNDIEALRAMASTDTCAILLECIQGEGGVIPAQQQYLQEVRKLCDDLGVLLILDEVQTGMCRTGKMFCFEHYGVLPDIIALAKGLGGGFPIGAILSTQTVADAFHPGDHGTTFGGNPLACACALSVLTTMLEEQIAAQVAQTGTYFLDQLKAMAATKKSIVEVRGKGLLIGIELDAACPARELQLALLERGFVVGTAANNTLRLVPPLIIKKDAIDALLVQIELLLA